MVFFINLTKSPNLDVNEWSLFVGQRLVNGVEEFEMSLGIVDIKVSKSASSNIALLQLAKPVSYKDYIQPVCVDISNTRSFPAGTQCWVAGWEKGSKSTGNDLSSFWFCCKYIKALFCQ